MKGLLAVAAVLVAVGAVAVVSVLVLSPGTTAVPSSAPVPVSSLSAEPVVVKGNLVVRTTFDTVEISENLRCTGIGTYADVVEGAQVVVSDATGRTIGVGRLQFGLLAEAGCTFPFEVAGVPGDEPFYGVQIANRGRLQYTAAQMSAPIEMIIGD
ncbi:hypothetical protein ACFWYW_55750 [Nonomuraea sp. NPDC059023]|uniref:hypothetical protein n=1 Tax=unclassified Nonomuraea TaxID=2593643 RepID=UPI0036CBE1FC